jgi:Fe-S oxidoreductase
MLTSYEQIAFILLIIVCGAIAFQRFSEVFAIVTKGQPSMHKTDFIQRLIKALVDVGAQKTISKSRPMASTFHALIFFGFSFYVLVNVNDVLEAYVAGWTTVASTNPIARTFNILSDLFSIAVLSGVVYFLVRRFAFKPKSFEFNQNVKLQPAVAAGGIKRDSLIVGVFIIVHVGSRWLGTIFHLAEKEYFDPFMPTASLVAPMFYGAENLEVGIHVAWWLAMGLIVMFLPYFPKSKHIHLMIAPLNLAFRRDNPVGELEKPSNKSKPGAKELSDLPLNRVLNSYACIMCNRCQDVCPAHESGAPLSPGALEINKRYYINRNAKTLAGEGPSQEALLDYAISEDGVWACTTCFACANICPVGNEPIMDLIDMRRNQVFDAQMPGELADALKGLDEQGNSLGESARKRSAWTKPLDFKIKDATKESVKYLWFVGDYASYNQNCLENTRKFAQIMQEAGIDFGIMGKKEKSAGNDVRRAGEEGLFEVLAESNIESLNECEFEEIITTDPHTYNTIKNEYPAFGSEFKIQHYSTFLLDLINSGKINLKKKLDIKATYHDPCYLGRYNNIYDAPRQVMEKCGAELVEMPRNKSNSFCCGAGGGRIWIPDHEDVKQRPSELRMQEASSLGVDHFAVACPKDMTMFSDAIKTVGLEGKMQTVDIVDLVWKAMGLDEKQAEETSPKAEEKKADEKAEKPAQKPEVSADISKANMSLN